MNNRAIKKNAICAALPVLMSALGQKRTLRSSRNALPDARAVHCVELVVASRHKLSFESWRLIRMPRIERWRRVIFYPELNFSRRRLVCNFGNDAKRKINARCDPTSGNHVSTGLIRPRSGSIMKTPGITIVSPHDYDRFVLSPHRTNRIRFRAIVKPVVDHVTWLIDGKEVEKTPPPYQFFWKPTVGRHVVHAVTPNRRAAQVIIHVE